MQWTSHLSRRAFVRAGACLAAASVSIATGDPAALSVYEPSLGSYYIHTAYLASDSDVHDTVYSFLGGTTWDVVVAGAVPAQGVPTLSQTGHVRVDYLAKTGALHFSTFDESLEFYTGYGVVFGSGPAKASPTRGWGRDGWGNIGPAVLSVGTDGLPHVEIDDLIHGWQFTQAIPSAVQATGTIAYTGS